MNWYGVKIDPIGTIVSRWTNLTANRCAPDWINFVILSLLSLLGLAFIYSVQSHGLLVKWKSQATWILIGFLGYSFVSCINYRIYMQFAHWFYLFAIFLLLLLWTPFGKKIGGSLRWLKKQF